MKHIIMINVSIKGYGDSLTEYMSQRKDFPFEARQMSDAEEICRYFDKGLADLLITDRKNLRKFEKVVEPERIIILDEEENGGANSIYAYQDCDRILAKIMRIATEVEDLGDLIVRNRAVKVLGVFDPTGSGSRNMMGLVLSRYIAKKKSVIYLNLLSFSVLDDVMGSRISGDMADLIMKVKSSDSEIISAIGECSVTEGSLTVMAPLRNYKDLTGMDEAEWMNLVSLIERKTAFEYIVLELSASVRGLLELMNMCDRVFFPEPDGGLESRSHDALFDNLRRNGMEDIVNRVRKYRELRISGESGSADCTGMYNSDKIIYGRTGEYISELLEGC
ncbi:MAG: hypothetical protein K5662_06545 [Lachnospiraceae bacterium]|nr:hypothetical protein [Lachnospiraceae bacterium]